MSTDHAGGDPAELVEDGAVSVADAAKFLGIGRTQVYEMIAAGELRSIRIGSRRLLMRAELKRFLATKLAAN